MFLCDHLIYKYMITSAIKTDNKKDINIEKSFHNLNSNFIHRTDIHF